MKHKDSFDCQSSDLHSEDETMVTNCTTTTANSRRGSIKSLASTLEFPDTSSDISNQDSEDDYSSDDDYNLF